jgi:hypothetical protein
MSAVLTTAERLQRELSDPVSKQEIAAVLGVGVASVYDSLRKFDAARIAGDFVEMKRQVPCIHLGGVPQPDGTYKGGRFIVPRDTFIAWYTIGFTGEMLAGLAEERAS